jgi:hypothetical protein
MIIKHLPPNTILNGMNLRVIVWTQLHWVLQNSTQYSTQKSSWFFFNLEHPVMIFFAASVQCNVDLVLHNKVNPWQMILKWI